ncbi:hypothetical protein ACFWTC_32345 [Streptomyces sp. NPDC058619]|uniref:hypothetical protein n=1 Tax=unclassified Streptomyces TaxID=2593676 RepID=UPI00365FB555
MDRAAAAAVCARHHKNRAASRPSGRSVRAIGDTQAITAWCFATLHTNDTSQTMDRIVDAFPAKQQPQIRTQLAHTLVGILNQTLIPRIGGGRAPAFEVLVGTSAVRNLIREGKTRQIRNMIATGHRDGMQTLETSINALVKAGTVTYEQAVRCTAYPEDIHRPHAPAGRT